MIAILDFHYLIIIYKLLYSYLKIRLIDYYNYVNDKYFNNLYF